MGASDSILVDSPCIVKLGYGRAASEAEDAAENAKEAEAATEAQKKEAAVAASCLALQEIQGNPSRSLAVLLGSG
jgi:hypothetical protein